MSYQIPIHDVDLAVAEVRRVVDLGAKSLQLPVFPNELGLPEYFDDRYVPLLRTIEESGLPVCCHIGLKTTLEDVARRDPTPNMGVMVPMTPLMTAEAFGMWIMGGVFERFPELKVVFVEPGLAWVAWWLEMVDDMVNRQGYEYPAISELPSHYFHRNIFLTFVDEHLGLQRTRDLLGVGNILWSTDFPHPVTSWPNSRQIVADQFEGIPADERELILSGNALRVWNLESTEIVSALVRSADVPGSSRRNKYVGRPGIDSPTGRTDDDGGSRHRNRVAELVAEGSLVRFGTRSPIGRDQLAGVNPRTLGAPEHIGRSSVVIVALRTNHHGRPRDGDSIAELVVRGLGRVHQFVHLNPRSTCIGKHVGVGVTTGYQRRSRDSDCPFTVGS